MLNFEWEMSSRQSAISSQFFIYLLPTTYPLQLENFMNFTNFITFYLRHFTLFYGSKKIRLLPKAFLLKIHRLLER